MFHLRAHFAAFISATPNLVMLLLFWGTYKASKGEGRLAEEFSGVWESIPGAMIFMVLILAITGVLTYILKIDELRLHIPAHHEHPFRTNVNTDSGST